ncbi:MAG: ATP-binding protein [Inquilinus sp.]|uniref:ATP-binding protein n=1 Tax=Inquilinus sp. TaxID=1932117 RepID=UPI003F3D9B28
MVMSGSFAKGSHAMTDVAEASSFWIDRGNLCLWRSHAGGKDERVRLMPKSFDLLAYLAENPGRLVTHDELLEALWPGVHVQPEVLKSHILAIRTALGDTISSPRFIETERGRGYRFIGRLRAGPSPVGKPSPAVDLGVFAGRAEPLRSLLALLERAAVGEPQSVFISGEPGFGKTTLVQQFLARASTGGDFVVAQGHCVENFAGAEPYYPIFEALGELCKDAGTGAARALEALAPSWAAQMPVQFSAAQRAVLQQQVMPGAPSRMVREACSLFEALPTERPLILVQEDLHWADFATIDLISALCRRRSSAKLLLIATYRPEDSTEAQRPLRQMTQDLALHKFSTEIELAPLSLTAITEILSGGTGDKANSSEFGQLIETRTGGNPLFMRVVLEHLLQRGDVERTGLGWRPLARLSTLASETPPTLGRAIETELEGMTDAQRRVLEAASVVGDPFDSASVASAADVDEPSFEAVCDDLPSSAIRPGELLRLPGGQPVRTYTFSHAIYRQVLYDRIGQTRRAQLHRAVGERLEEIYPPDQRDEVATRLAQHFALAGDWSRALDYLRSALRIANSRFAWRDALAILDQAAALAANLPETTRIPAEIELLERRASIQAGVALDPNARGTYAELAAKIGRHGDIDAQCRALLGQAYSASWYDLVTNLQLLDEVLALCEQQTDPIRRDVIRMAAHTRRLWTSGWNKAEARECEEALARLKISADTVTIARAEINFSMLCLVSARYREVKDLVDSSYGLIRDSPRDVIDELANSAWMRLVGVPWSIFSLGDFGTALAGMDASIGDFEKGGDSSAASFTRVFRGALLFHGMDFEATLRDCGPVASQPFEHHAGPDTQTMPLKRRIALIYCGLAEMGLGNIVAALEYLRAAEGEMERQPVHLDWYWRLALEWGMVGALIATGDHAAAHARAQRLCDRAAQTDERAWQALAWEARARAALVCGEAAEAVADVTEALAACEGVTVPLAEWRAHATGAAVCKAAGDLRQARTHGRLGAAIRKRLAGSLPEGDPLRLTFERRSEALAAI